MSGTLYYVGNLNGGEKSLVDNLSRRFSTKAVYGGQTLSKGDCLLLNAEDVPSDIKTLPNFEAILQSFRNGALFAFDGGTGARYGELCEAMDIFDTYGSSDPVVVSNDSVDNN